MTQRCTIPRRQRRQNPNEVDKMQGIRKRAGMFVLLLAGLALIAPAFLSGTSTMGGYGGMMGGWMFIWPLLLIGGLVWLLGSFQNQTEQRSHDTALETLRTQYARGEISEDEFENRRRTLRLKE